MTEQLADEVPTTMSGVSTTVSDMVTRLRDAAPEVDLERIRDGAASALDSASSALSSVDIDAGRKAVKKRTKAARKAAKSASKSASAARVSAVAAGKTAAMHAQKGKAAIKGKPSLRERIFDWPLYTVAATGAVLGSLAWWRSRQRAALETAPPPPAEINVVDPADVEASQRRSTG